MFTEVQIENYKSIQSLKIGLGRVNVFIGENGCGKSNILEAIALAGAAAADKLDNEFLYSRGIRVTEPEFMRSAFDKENTTKEITINFKETDKVNDEEIALNFMINHDNQPYSKWKKFDLFEHKNEMEDVFRKQKGENLSDFIARRTQELLTEHYNDLRKTFENIPPELLFDEIAKGFKTAILFQVSQDLQKNSFDLMSFIIYSPENSLLRNFIEEGQVQPLGTKGEGLLKLLRVLSDSPDKIKEIKQRLELIDWFDDFKMSVDSELERNVQIKDRYLDKELPYFNQRSSNEGFLFLMFYFALFVSDDTPKFFAIDNIENALNPKLCTRLIQELVELAKKYDKQVIFTTHNPAVLDGLDLTDDEQRLFVIYRNMDGHTKARQIAPLEPLEDDEIVPLSEAFINGYIGGLPKNF
ncbi:AAA family ATPase [Pseudanabaena yagii]|uniref:AAA family ATPase n=1 Tax=Pseudanabaena yagii GIHE-NHR1 TaxID=2722753 RepID=A0ABX1LQI4_9CYAN|nr:ATP-binding protein [Pseudanabaena yagii]NMF57360.1 AAA family ATPase [Pseudanabaena yagii GIHE-NHR1]